MGHSETRTTLNRGHPVHRHFNISPSTMTTRNKDLGPERRPLADTTSRNNTNCKTRAHVLAMDTQVERSVDAHSPRKSEPAPPTTPRSNKRKRNGGSTRSNNSNKQRRNSEYVHQGSHGTESATVDLTTPKSSEGSSSVSPRNPTSSHRRRSRYDSKSPLQRSYQANSTPNGRKRSRSLRRSHRRQPVSAFEAVHIPKSSVCKKPSGAEQTNTNGLQGQLRRQQPSRQAKPFTSIEHQVNPYDGGDTPYSWDEPVVFNISDVEQWKRDNILDGMSLSSIRPFLETHL